MIKLLLVLILLSTQAMAVETDLPAGPHTRAKRFSLEIMVPTHDSKRIDDVVIPFKMMTVWESYKVCITETQKLSLMDKTDDIDIHLSVDTWLKNVDTSEYYQQVTLKSWQGDQCSPVEKWANPIHVQHRLRNTIRCTNHDDVARSCKVNVWLLGK